LVARIRNQDSGDVTEESVPDMVRVQQQGRPLHQIGVSEVRRHAGSLSSAPPWDPSEKQMIMSDGSRMASRPAIIEEVDSRLADVGAWLGPMTSA
jgi:hypothetical protein